MTYRHCRRDRIAGSGVHGQGNVVDLILYILIKFLWIMSWAVIARALISWVDPRGTSTISRLLSDITEPIVGPIRSVIPRIGMFDISPIFAWFLLRFLMQVLTNVSNNA
jgi:YggT family protein